MITFRTLGPTNRNHGVAATKEGFSHTALSPIIGAFYGLSTIFLSVLVQQSNSVKLIAGEQVGNQVTLITPSDVSVSIDSPNATNISSTDRNSTCFGAQEVLLTYVLDTSGLLVENFTNTICPALTNQATAKNCPSYKSSPRQDYLPSMQERYGYGTLALVVISAVPLFIFFFIPKPDHPKYRYVMQAITALAVSTLLSDTFLHLLPLALELKKPTYANNKVIVSNAVIKGTMTLGPIYFLYLLEMLVGTRNRLGNGDLDDSGHSHNQQKMERRRSHRLVAADAQLRVRSLSDSAPIPIAVREENFAKLQQQPNTANLSRMQRFIREVRLFLRECIPKKHFGWMIILGDNIHNVMDGIALGAAFSNNPISGLSTSIAVLFHEVPHEISDFVALMTSGVSWRGAMAWDVVSTTVAFISFFIGISVSTDPTARQWVFAFTAGIFLHHALTEFLPELQHINGNFWRYFALHNIGILGGFFVIIIVTIFEDAIHYSVKNSPYLAVNVTKI